MMDKKVFLIYIQFFWQGTTTERVRRVVNRHFKYNSERVHMHGSMYHNSNGSGGWYHAE